MKRDWVRDDRRKYKLSTKCQAGNGTYIWFGLGKKILEVDEKASGLLGGMIVRLNKHAFAKGEYFIDTNALPANVRSIFVEGWYISLEQLKSISHQKISTG